MQGIYNKSSIESLNKDIEKNFEIISQVQPDDVKCFDSVSRMVMLDRYSQKDKGLTTLKVGDVVITTIKDDNTFPTRGIGTLKEIKGNKYIVEVDAQYVGQIDPLLLEQSKTDNCIIKDKFSLEKPLELFFEQIARRVGKALAKAEGTTEQKQEWTEKFVHELEALNVVPAGRVLYGAGSDSKVTFFNCYVMPYIEDSREGISKHRSQVTEIMSRGGGVGTNGSTLRPKATVAKGVGGRSSGSVSWLNDLSQLTHLIEQGGSRRGAQMIMLSDWHPDIIEFIISKMQNPDILMWLKTKSNSELIRQAANAKLTFEPMKQSEREIFEYVSKNPSSVSADALRLIQTQLKDGGKWTVNNPHFLSGANISVAISHPFMEAVEKNKSWDLKFPDIEGMTAKQKEFYDNEWKNIGNVFEWEKLGYPVKVYETIKAKDLWDLINFCATYSAEPGIFFIDAANDMTNAQGYGQKVVATNPCGEQPLAPFSVCNLSAINLSNFVNKETKEVLYDALSETVKVCVRMQDNVIDETPYFLEENKKQALGERRVGMGVMGLHDLLIWAGVKYGSKEGNKIVDKVFETITLTAYRTSIELAKEKGVFPFLENKEKFAQSGFIKTLPKDIQDGIKKFGIRNSHLVTVAPTGSTGTMVGCSTGLEPYFAFSYFRSGRLGKFMEVKSKIVQEWLDLNPQHTDESKLPDFFVSAMELSPEAHVEVQCIIQRWVDSSISKTVNAPKGYSVAQVEKVYMQLYKGGAKGGTIYVDGSRDTQVLSLEIEKTKDKKGFVDDLEPINHENEFIKKTVDEKNIGTEIGDTCPICTIGVVIEQGGCHTCPECGSQLKCGL